MTNWTPEPLWEGEDVTIIGGGDSLRNFPWEVLRDTMTIGCNVAYQLGKDIATVVIFGDKGFLLDKKKSGRPGKHYHGLQAYGGPVFCAAKMRDCRLPLDWVYMLKRINKGMYVDAIGWNGNTGAAAINLAFLLGAKRVFLLGFDMHQRKNAKASWHNEYDGDGKNRKASYPKYLLAFDSIVKDWKEKFSDREIINVNDDSALDCFPMMSVSEFLKERRAA